MTKKDVKHTIKKVVATAGKVGKVALGSALILTHIALSAIDALVCAIMKE